MSYDVGLATIIIIGVGLIIFLGVWAHINANACMSECHALGYGMDYTSIDSSFIPYCVCDTETVVVTR